MKRTKLLTQPNPIQSYPWMNPIHVPLFVISMHTDIIEWSKLNDHFTFEQMMMIFIFFTVATHTNRWWATTQKSKKNSKQKPTKSRHQSIYTNVTNHKKTVSV